jgi:antitoxin (DNA-binding transcriptional repressor) of toxin-antitoxin stability system
MTPNGNATRLVSILAGSPASINACTGIDHPIDIAKYFGYTIDVKRVKIGEFRDRASELIRRAAGGETVVILNRDREVAKIVSITTKTERAGGLIGCLAGTAEVRGDIEAPIASPDAWFRDLS